MLGPVFAPPPPRAAAGAPCDGDAGKESTAVCFYGELRAINTTAWALQRYVLDALDAGGDFFVHSPVRQQSQRTFFTHPFTRDARNISWLLLGEERDMTFVLEDLAPQGAWRDVVRRNVEASANRGKAPPNWLGGVHGIRGSGQWISYGLKRCGEMIAHAEHERGCAYDRVVLTRPDLHWVRPHPPLTELDRGFTWMQHGEDNHGLNDRHAVLARDSVAAAALFSRFDRFLRGDVPDVGQANNEKLTRADLERAVGAEASTFVRRFACSAYLTCATMDEFLRLNITSWASCKVDREQLRHKESGRPVPGGRVSIYKYKPEYRCATSTVQAERRGLSAWSSTQGGRSATFLKVPIKKATNAAGGGERSGSGKAVVQRRGRQRRDDDDDNPFRSDD